MKTPNMKALAESEFDCVFDLSGAYPAIGHIGKISGYFVYDDGTVSYSMEGADGHIVHSVLPRLNEAQVLTRWDWVPAGFMWNAVWINRIADEKYSEIVDSRRLKEIALHDLHYFISAACVGLSLGYELEGMEVYTEVVK